MANQKISQLTNIASSGLSDVDEFAVVDASATETKAITYGELKNFNGAVSSTDSFQVSGSGDRSVSITSTNSNDARLDLLRSSANSYRLTNDGGDFKIQHGSTPAGVATNTRITVTNAGDVGIGTTTPSEKLHVTGTGETILVTPVLYSSSQDSAYLIASATNYTGADTNWGTYGLQHRLKVDADGTPRVTIDTSLGEHFAVTGNGDVEIKDRDGNVILHSDGTNDRIGIGTTTPLTKLHSYQTGSQYAAMLESNQTNTSMLFASTGSVNKFYQGISTGDGTDMRIFAGNTTRMTVTSAGDVGIGTAAPSEKLHVVGNVTISGSLSKGSGSFKIDHPLKPETHHLVHSFVESPQADNIYRGTAVLVGGQATVNLDTAGRMSEGTFVALNGNVQCFTSNEDGWAPVRGYVSGNILTIEAQDNTCTDTVSWMVVGERIDQHMIDASWTDDNGRVITEPLKPETTE